jgi:hypothetical protein
VDRRTWASTSTARPTGPWGRRQTCREPPAASFDTIYDFAGAQLNVATAAPGDAGFNGGRWRVHAVSFNSSYATTLAAHDLNGDGVIDTNAEVASALTDGSSSGATDLGIVKSFECPVIHVN